MLVRLGGRGHGHEAGQGGWMGGVRVGGLRSNNSARSSWTRACGRQAGRQAGRQTTGRKLHGTRPHGSGYSTALRLGLKGPVLRRDDSDCVMAWQVCVYGLGWGAVGGWGGLGGRRLCFFSCGYVDKLWTCEV